jgi:hypothetical protein
VHPEAYTGFQWLSYKSGVSRLPVGTRILDVGGQYVNGSVHDLLPFAQITTLDLENADIVADARLWEPDRLFDVVIATEVFEHVKEWRRVIHTMRKALDPAGPGFLLATCASTDRPRHGATGAPRPAPGEWYQNVEPVMLRHCLGAHFSEFDVVYQYPPGDAYMWGRV